MQQKSSFLPQLSSQQVPVVQFSRLDENNKAQFLQFLIKNNITFDNAGGKQNVVAKVTLKTLTPNKNLNNKTTVNNNLNAKTIGNNKKVVNQKVNNSNNNTNRKYEDQQNNENFSLTNNNHNNIKTNNKSKSPLKNNQINNNNKKLSFAQATISPFKKVNPHQQNAYLQEKQPIRKLYNMRDSSLLQKNQQQTINKKGQILMNIDLSSRQKTPDDRKNQTLISPTVKSASKRVQQKSSQKLIYIKDSNISVSPVRSARDVSCTKQSSHQRLSNFKKQNMPKTMRQSSIINQQPQSIINNRGDTIYHKNNIKKTQPNKNNNKREKIRNKVITKQNKLNQSRQLVNNNNSRQKYTHNPLRNQSFQSLNRIQLVNKYKQYFNNFNNSSTTNTTFNTSLFIRQRPICWPLAQIQKLLDQFYDDNFIKNTNQILNGSKKLNQSLKKTNHNNKYSHIAQSLQKFLNRKFNKVQKAIQYNLINLLYSIAYYINEYKQLVNQQQEKQNNNNSNASILSLTLFQDFLSLKFQLQDYLFFLFCRNILKQDFKKSFIPSTSLTHINKKQIDKFLKHIVGVNNSQILQEYHRMVFQKISGYEIQINKFMKILVQDYKLKRQAAQQTKKQQKLFKQHHHNKYDFKENDQVFEQQESSSLQNTFNKILCLGGGNRLINDNNKGLFDNTGQMIREDSMQELTFGEDTKDMLRQVDIGQTNNNKNHKNEGQEQEIQQQQQIDEIQFWQSPYINQRQSRQQKQRLLKDEFNQIIVQKLCQKTHQLVQLLSSTSSSTIIRQHHRNNNNYHQQNPLLAQPFNNDDNQQNNTYSQQYQQQQLNQLQQIQQLLFSKALCLFFTVIQMNKVKWLKQLYIINPTQQDVEKVQQIQLFFRKIKQYPSAKDIAQFTKLILTVKQITQSLSKFFV